MSPMDDLFLSSSIDQTIRLWDTRTPVCQVNVNFKNNNRYTNTNKLKYNKSIIIILFLYKYLYLYFTVVNLEWEK